MTNRGQPRRSPLGSPGTIFPSKRDRWAAVLFWSIALTLWATGLWLALQDGVWEERAIAFGAGLLSGWAVLWFWVTTRYRVTATTLHLYSGCFHSEIPLRKIRAVRTSRRSWWGMSYALSLEAMQIEVEDSRIGYQISPQDRAGFLRLIAERCGHLVEKDGDLVRRI